MASKTVTIKLEVDTTEFLESIRKAIHATDMHEWLLNEAAALIGKADDGGHHGCITDSWKRARAKWLEEYRAHIPD